MKVTETKSTAIQAKSNNPFFGRGGGFFGPSRSAGFFPGARSGPASGARSGGGPGARTGIVQTKLTIGEPHDTYEKEADSVADKVVQRLGRVGENHDTAPAVTPLTGVVTEINRSTAGVIQECAACEQEQRLQRKEEEIPQPKTDRLRKKPIFQSNEDPGEGDDPIQRKCAECTAQEKHLQKKGGDNGGASPSLENSISSTRGGGSRMSPETNSSMSQAFGADFSNVRIHTDSSAAAMNKELNAQAFTQGKDIYFDSGKYDDRSKDGKKLLAHELTHTLQQDGSMIRRLPSWSDIKAEAASIAGSVSDVASDAYQEVKKGASEVAHVAEEGYEEVKKGVNEVADVAEAGYQEVKQGVDAVTEWVATKAGQLAVRIANGLLEQFGGSITVLEGGGLEIRLPEVVLINRYSKTFSWGKSTPDAIIAQLPLDLGEWGILFLTLFARGEIHAALMGALGPVKLKDITLTIDRSSNLYAGEGTLSSLADITGLLELTGILGGSVDWNCLVEAIKVEGGLSGTGTAGASSELSARVKVIYHDGEFTYDGGLDLNNCLTFSLDLDALANLYLVQTPIWSGNWNLANWAWDKCWPIDLLVDNYDYHGGGGTSGGGGSSDSYGFDGGGSSGSFDGGGSGGSFDSDQSGSGFIGGGGRSGGGGARGSWDGPDSGFKGGGGDFGGGGGGGTFNIAGAVGGLTNGSGGDKEPNTPGWNLSDMLKKLFSTAKLNSNLDLSKLDAKAKDQVQAKCPIKKDPSKKPYKWETPHRYEDMNGRLTYSTNRPGTDWTTHAHHVWPKNIGGPEKQTRLNVIQTIHLSEFHGTNGIHTYLSASLRKELNGTPITRHKTDPGNQLLIRKMRHDANLRRKVFRLLSSYYRNYRNQSQPQLPEWTYLTGLNESVNNIK